MPKPEAVNLTTEHLTDPLGIDVTIPRVSWQFRHLSRGAKQTAYRIQAANSPGCLSKDSAVWDSGKVESDDSILIPLKKIKTVSGSSWWWRVKVWDQDNQGSEWSAPAFFEMGLMNSKDWKGEWITSPLGGNGYHSAITSNADDPKWVQIDLETSAEICAVKLHPARPYNWNEDTPGFGFPVRYKVEISDDPDFTTCTLASDKTAQDQPNPGDSAVELQIQPVTGRYIRLTATRLYTRMDGQKLLALSQIQALTNLNVDLASGKSVTALDRIEDSGWSPEMLTEGLAENVTTTRCAPLFRKEFKLDKKPVKARAYVVGLGYCELFINGRKAGDRVLDPPYTNFTKRVLYSTYDVTDLLQKGANCVGAILGKGWFGKSPRLLLQMNIEFKDGSSASIVSDDSWKRGTSPILENSLYHGETYDARLEQDGWNTAGFDDSHWDKVCVTQSPAPLVTSQMCPPIRITDEHKHVSLTGVADGVWVFDYGQNMSGWGRLQLGAPPGTTVKLKFSELLYDSGYVNQENLRSARATDTYITKGGVTEIYEPRFTYHGFRYIQMEGFPGQPAGWEVMTACEVHTDLKKHGEFECSNELINKIHNNSVWGFKTNYHSVPTDCPQRDERQGWMGDAHMTADMGFYNFDMSAAYTKFLQDIRDAQGDDGRIPDTVPHVWGTNPGDPMWSAAYHIIAWDMFRHTGDVGMLEQHYFGMKSYVDLLAREADGFIITRNNYGDWVGIAETPKDLISTGSFYLVSKIVEKAAKALGNEEDAEQYGKLCKRIAKAFNDKYLNTETSVYGNSSQYSYVWPLYLGIVPSKNHRAVVDNLVKDILENHKGHLSTGFLGARYLFEVLCNEGRPDVAWEIISKKDYPSYGYMIEMGATTVWELWKYETGPGMNSHNHPAFGFISGWFYRDIAGIRPCEALPGFKGVVIKPHLMGDLTEAKAYVDTIRGKVSSHWKREEGALTLNVTIPPGSIGWVWVSKMALADPVIKEGDAVVWSSRAMRPGVAGITDASDEGDWVMFDVQGGCYSFTVSE